MLSFKKFLVESLHLQRIHRNPSTAAIKNITRDTAEKFAHNNDDGGYDYPHGRFSVTDSGHVHFASGRNYTHTDLNQDAGVKVSHIQGHTFYHPKRGYEWDAYGGREGQFGGRTKDLNHNHPFLKQLSNAGFKLKDKFERYER
jgi:hypothetical protein